MPSISNSDDLAGQVAVVTGAAQGIGAAICATLADHGVTIVAMDIQPAPLQRLAEDLAGAHPVVVDVRDAPAVRTAIDTIAEQFGGIDILIAAAGVLRTGPATEITAPDWREVMAVNLDAVMHTCQAAAQHMIPRRRGTIIAVASNAASVPRMNMAAYAASKAATRMFIKCLGLELAVHGIRCNTVSPGSTDTSMQRQLWTSPDDAHAVITGSLARFRPGIPLGRIATPADIADAVLFLASARARHITMHDLIVDGGASLSG
ncbi:2,3-dihydro-2,3-dihydroxybenzoate dehydrogenase [Streptosporangium sp. CA-115845]|uniref:2,3-dihydro-2,3-dihydroxybenzoate dehydrogenase n=1 Tax=Streptosporangium sp. CA-115845 TaxID=3240071 RepID=UPI003D8C6351